MDGAVGPLGELAGQVPVHGVLDLPLDDVPEDLAHTAQCSRGEGAQGHQHLLHLCLSKHLELAGSRQRAHLAPPGVEPVSVQGVGTGQGQQQQQQLRLCRTQVSGLEVASSIVTSGTAPGSSITTGWEQGAPTPNPMGHRGYKSPQGCKSHHPCSSEPQGSPLPGCTSTLPVLAASCRGFNPS